MKTVIRPDAKGDPDDVVISDVTMFRMERMDSGKVWIACYRGDERVCFWLDAPRRIRMKVTEDDLGCVDDSDDDPVVMGTYASSCVLAEEPIDQGPLPFRPVTHLGVQ